VFPVLFFCVARCNIFAGGACVMIDGLILFLAAIVWSTSDGCVQDYCDQLSDNDTVVSCTSQGSTIVIQLLLDFGIWEFLCVAFFCCLSISRGGL